MKTLFIVFCLAVPVWAAKDDPVPSYIELDSQDHSVVLEYCMSSPASVPEDQRVGVCVFPSEVDLTLKPIEGGDGGGEFLRWRHECRSIGFPI
jgi:hypothetical protein